MNAIVVDDSRLARNELKRLIKDLDIVKIIGEASNAEEAREKIEAEKPDLIFLDIQMPGKSGFDLLQDLEYVPEVIFTTAYDEYAIKAFEYNALDYLLKPIHKDRLAGAIGKLVDKQRANRINAKTDPNLMGENDQVFVKDGERCWFVSLSKIRIFEVDGNYTKLHFEDEHPMIPRTLNYLESKLDPKVFFRANRQQIVNLKWVEKIEPWFSGSIRIYMKGGQEVDVSRRQTQRFKDLMSI